MKYIKKNGKQPINLKNKQREKRPIRACNTTETFTVY